MGNSELLHGSEIFPPEGMPIRLRVLNMMADIGLLGKDGQAPEKIGAFKFLSSDQIKAVLHPALIKWGITFTVDVEDATVQFIGPEAKPTVFTMVKVRCSMCSWDHRPEDEQPITGVSWGEGLDRQDKGMGKAITAAVKFWLNHNLTLQGDIDIESESVDVGGGGNGHSHRPSQRSNAPEDFSKPRDHKYDVMTKDEVFSWWGNRWEVLLSSKEAFVAHLKAHDEAFVNRDAVPMPYLLNGLRKAERILGRWNEILEAAAACGVSRQDLADRVKDSRIPLPEWDEDALGFWLEELATRAEATNAQDKNEGGESS